MNYLVTHFQITFKPCGLQRARDSKFRHASRSEYCIPDIPLIRLVNQRWQDSILFILLTVGL